ncbi:CrcB family protein [Candidatus Dependentiae bacterium]|nr:CrcB family protein [Candidatus Dependentiae bacterium]
MFVGAGLGGACRHALSCFVSGGAGNFGFGVVSVNYIGCFFAGLLLFVMQNSGLSRPVTLFFMVGLLGGFTTFSAFGVETILYLQRSQFILALGNILMSLLALVMVYFGYLFARFF